ncbi:hypothetical protein KR222_002503, partial [Zaprionus bogoriensis]
MRRSQAPSVRQAIKRGAAAPACAQPAEKMQWGTTGGYRTLGPRRYSDDEDPLRNRRIFLVLWRNQSNKKHKTWTGNGTLELTTTQATLKNETGRTLDVLTCFKPEKIHEGALLEVGSKDVEIQEELKTKAECVAQRKEELENWYRQQEEANGVVYSEEDRPSKPHRSMHLLKKPRHATEAHTVSNKLSEYICMLTPAELQVKTLQLLAEHPPGAVKELAQWICDHPVLLKHLLHEPLVSELLLPHLPPWSEMGLYDSAKFEFVHLMLDNWVVGRGEKCAIVASSQLCLDIIGGYCQCWQIPHQQLDESLEDDDKPAVRLLLAGKLPAVRLSNCKHLILYNYSARSAGIGLLAGDSDTQIYTLITAGCLEEQQFQQHLG